MKREVIILSDLDIKLMEFVREERIMNDIVDNFNMSHSQVKKHSHRIKKLDGVSITKYGNFRRIKLTQRGEDIISIIKNE